MPRPRFERLDPEVQDRILDAAAAEFAAHGAQAASFNRIIQAAGISKGAIYYYFDDKEDLFLTVVRRAVLRLRDRVGGMAVGEMPESDFWGAVEALIRDTWAATLETPDALPLTKAALALGVNPARTEAVAGFLDEMHDWIGRVLAHGQTLGAVRDDLPLPLLARLVGGAGQAMDEWTLEAMGSGELDATESDMERVIGIYVDTLRRVAAP